MVVDIAMFCSFDGMCFQGNAFVLRMDVAKVVLEF